MAANPVFTAVLAVLAVLCITYAHGVEAQAVQVEQQGHLRKLSKFIVLSKSPAPSPKTVSKTFSITFSKGRRLQDTTAGDQVPSRKLAGIGITFGKKSVSKSTTVTAASPAGKSVGVTIGRKLLGIPIMFGKGKPMFFGKGKAVVVKPSPSPSPKPVSKITITLGKGKFFAKPTIMLSKGK
eukprot:jgi/Chrzof1/10801/Cz05g12170.t1